VTYETLTCEAVAQRGLVELYVSGRLSAERDVSDLETHLLTCDTCREEVRLGSVVRAELGAPATLHQVRSLPRRSAWVFLGAAAAAAVVFVIARPISHDGSDRPVVRGGEEGVPVIVAVSPAPAAVVPPASLAFVWRSVGTGAQYRLTVTNSPGDVVWTGASADTVQHVRPNARLRSGQSYFWYVDALLPDGGSATSRVRRFTLAP
jgi:hypothetical protein